MSGQIEELVLRAKRRDQEAFSELYQMYVRKIYRFVYYLLQSYEAAEDITQETFLRAWRSLPTFSIERGTFQAFLFAIARNLVTDLRRKKPTVPLSDVDEPAIFDTIEEELIQEEAKERIWKVLRRLSPLEQHIVVLRFFEELPFSEIAQIVGMNEGAVRVRLHRVLKQLKIYLEKIL